MAAEHAANRIQRRLKKGAEGGDLLATINYHTRLIDTIAQQEAEEVATLATLGQGADGAHLDALLKVFAKSWMPIRGLSTSYTTPMGDATMRYGLACRNSC